MHVFMNNNAELTSTRTRTDEGFLVASGIVATEGIYEYRRDEFAKVAMPDGFDTSRQTFKIYKPASVLQSSQYLGSMVGKPITDNHPSSFVDTKNSHRVTRGHIQGKPKYDAGAVATLYITDAELINEIDTDQKVELSTGEDTRWIWETGSFNGQPYDGIMTSGTINHVAVVRKARAGAAARILNGENMDEVVENKTEVAPVELVAIDVDMTASVGRISDEVFTGGQDPVDNTFIKTVSTNTTALPDANTLPTMLVVPEAVISHQYTYVDQISALEKQVEQLQAQLAKMVPVEQVEKMANERADLLSVASGVIGSPAGKTNHEIRVQMINSLDNDAKIDNAVSEDFAKGLLSGLLKAKKTNEIKMNNAAMASLSGVKSVKSIYDIEARENKLARNRS